MKYIRFAIDHLIEQVYLYFQTANIIYSTFSHHYQGSIDFNTVNIQRTKGMYFLVLTGNRADIGGYDLLRAYYPIQSLCPRECTEKYRPRDIISLYTP